MGWRRYGRYLMLRLARLSDSNEEIARGLAHGAAVSWTPLPGTHVIAAVAMSWSTRSSPYGAVIGSLLVGNFWTLPFMWLASYGVGSYLFGLFGSHVKSMPAEFTWDNLVLETTKDPMGLFFPWVIGSIVLAFLTWPIFYYSFLRLIVWLRDIYINKKEPA